MKTLKIGKLTLSIEWGDKWQELQALHSLGQSWKSFVLVYPDARRKRAEREKQEKEQTK